MKLSASFRSYIKEKYVFYANQIQIFYVCAFVHMHVCIYECTFHARENMNGLHLWHMYPYMHKHNKYLNNMNLLAGALGCL